MKSIGWFTSGVGWGITAALLVLRVSNMPLIALSTCLTFVSIAAFVAARKGAQKKDV